MLFSLLWSFETFEKHGTGETQFVVGRAALFLSKILNSTHNSLYLIYRKACVIFLLERCGSSVERYLKRQS